MSLAAKLFVSIVLAAGLGVGALAGAAAHWVASAGHVLVRVDSADGGRLNVRVPAALAEIPVALVPSGTVEQAWNRAMAEAGDEAARELRGILPALREAGRRLDEAPDFTLLAVEGPDTDIRVEKRGGSWIVLVDDGGDHVEIRVPARLLRRITDKAALGRA